MAKAELPPPKDALQALVQALHQLPGVGQRTAQRMAFHLLQHDRVGAEHLAKSLQAAVAKVHHCPRCHAFTELALCDTCSDAQRNPHLLAVVEGPADQVALERSGHFHGYYFVLMGRFSPLDGNGPEQTGAHQLVRRACDGVVQEVVMATGFTAEGELTAQALGAALRSRGLKVTRLARGVPVGTDLEHADYSTLAYALADRR